MSNWFGRTAELAPGDSAQRLGLAHRRWIAGNEKAPLGVCVHGRAGNSGVMWTFTHALPSEVSLLFPEAILDDPDDGGKSWWLRNGMTPRAIDDAVERLSRFVESALDYYELRPAGIFGLGFSQGAALLSVAAQRHPKLFRGVALLSGFVVEDDGPVASPPLTDFFMAHGSRDTVVSIEQAKRGEEFLVRRGYRVEFHEDDVEHKVGKNGMRQLKVWAANLIQSISNDASHS